MKGNVPGAFVGGISSAANTSQTIWLLALREFREFIGWIIRPKTIPGHSVTSVYPTSCVEMYSHAARSATTLDARYAIA
jgi:hypothetical protein